MKPTEGDTAVANLCRELCTWGRWGPQDERGLLNLVGPSEALRAASLIVAGRSVSLARPIDPKVPDVHGPPQRLLLAEGAGPGQDDAEGWAPDAHHSAVEYVGLTFHGLTVTHLDAPAHISHEGYLYNGHRADSVHFAEGARSCSVTEAASGLFTRAVLLDVPGLRGVERLEPGEAVRPEELEACERRHGVVAGEGDVLLLHTGAPDRTNPPDPRGKAGFHWSCLPWLADRGIAVIGSDGINDTVPSGVSRQGFPLPLHVVGLVYMGLWLLDNCETSRLAATCRQTGRWEFALSLNVLALVGATGSPVNPVALF